MHKKANSDICLNRIIVHDSFWDKYVRLVKEVIIPYQWEVLNDMAQGTMESGCIKNFKIAAHEEQGTFTGVVFQDTDVAKWLEAVGFVLAYEDDKELEKTADTVIELLGRAQQPDGYLNTYYTISEPEKRWTNLEEGHELYIAGHMIEAAVAYYESTGKRRFLDIVCKMADLICKTFGQQENQIHGYPGHPEIELALVKLYRVTEEKRYLELAKYFIDIRGKGENYFLKEEKKSGFKRIFPEFEPYNPIYSQSHLPVREQTTAEGHAVRAVYLYCAMADLAWEYQDKSLMDTCEKLWNNIVFKRMYITGSIGSSGLLERFTTDYDLPNDSNYSESCASIGLALFGKRMASITGNASYMDVVERALYNTVLSGISMDGKSFFYVNPLEVWPPNCMEQTSKAHVKPVRQKWFGVACCPPNIARTLASLGQYLYFQEQDMLYINLYIGNTTEIKLNDHIFKINMDSSYPWQGKIEMKLSGEEKVDHTLAFRIPYGSSDFQISINGEIVENPVREQGYLKISREFQNDTISIRFSIPAVFIHANPEVRADIGKIAIMKGPLVYCLEEIDNGENLASLYISSHQEIQEDYDENILKGTSLLHLHGRKLRSHGWDEQTLYQRKEAEFEEVELTAVPYCYWGNRKTGEMLVWLKEWFE